MANFVAKFATDSKGLENFRSRGKLSHNNPLSASPQLSAIFYDDPRKFSVASPLRGKGDFEIS